MGTLDLDGMRQEKQLMRLMNGGMLALRIILNTRNSGVKIYHFTGSIMILYLQTLLQLVRKPEHQINAQLLGQTLFVPKTLYLRQQTRLERRAVVTVTRIWPHQDCSLLMVINPEGAAVAQKVRFPELQ